MKTRLYTAAKMLEALIKNHLDGDPGICEIEVLERDGFCLVSWESGPFEWAVALVGGSCIFAAELGGYSVNPWFDEVEAIAERYGVLFECKNDSQISVREV